MIKEPTGGKKLELGHCEDRAAKKKLGERDCASRFQIGGYRRLGQEVNWGARIESRKGVSAVTNQSAKNGGSVKKENRLGRP